MNEKLKKLEEIRDRQILRSKGTRCGGLVLFRRDGSPLIVPTTSINFGNRCDDENWVTINGTHVPLDDEGNAIGGGKLKGMNFSRAKSQKKSGQAKEMPEKQEKQSEQNHAAISRTEVSGEDVSASYTGEKDIKSVLQAQGFDGLPKVVSQDEFDNAVQESGFIAQRTYVASSQEVLDAYRDMLYDGEWYVDCSVGGAQYGQGMYCAADYSGQITLGIKTEMSHYIEVGRKRMNDDQAPYFTETLTLSKDAKIVEFEDITAMKSREHTDYLKKELDSYASSHGKEAEAYFRIETGTSKHGDFETVMKWESSNPSALQEAEQFYIEAKNQANNVMKEIGRIDVGAYAAMKGYDAINAGGHGQSGSYTVILNRTKTILLDGRNRSDSDEADGSTITFQNGEDGMVYAIRGGKVIGWVKASDGSN